MLKQHNDALLYPILVVLVLGWLAPPAALIMCLALALVACDGDDQCQPRPPTNRPDPT